MPQISMKPDPPGYYTATAANWIFFIVGISIIWINSHSWLAMLGGFIAAMHIRIKVISEKGG